MRLAVLRLEESARVFVWSFHHLLLDGWAVALLLEEILGLYTARHGGAPSDLAPRHPFHDYVTWLRRPDPPGAEELWRRKLAGAGAAVAALEPVAGATQGQVQARLSPSATSRLEAFARERQVTLATVIQAAWAIVLGRSGDTEDVTFGLVMAGRPPELEGASSMIGLFVNVLPLRLTLRPAAALADWLREVQQAHLELLPFETTPLARIEQWAGSPGAPLFASTLRFQNYPGGAGTRSGAAGIEVSGLGWVDLWHYPLNLAVAPGEQLTLQLGYDRRLAPERSVDLLAALGAVLEAMAAGEQRTLSAWLEIAGYACPGAHSPRKSEARAGSQSGLENRRRR
jgi:hypothetical protein